MNLRECTTFVIDHRQETFSYVFPHTTVVKPIIRPEMVARVAALMQYAGAEIKVIREDEEDRVMNTATKMSKRTHSVHDMLVAVWNGRADDVNGNALKRLKNDGCIFLDEGVASLSGKGRSFIDAVNAESAIAPTLSEDGVKAAAEVINEATADYEDLGVPVTAPIKGMIAPNNGNPDFRRMPRETIFPCITIPIPSASEVKLRQSLYDSIRESLRGSIAYGHLLTLLKAIEETDPLLSRSGD